jgi:hypothetical protein
MRATTTLRRRGRESPVLFDVNRCHDLYLDAVRCFEEHGVMVRTTGVRIPIVVQQHRAAFSQ